MMVKPEGADGAEDRAGDDAAVDDAPPPHTVRSDAAMEGGDDDKEDGPEDADADAMASLMTGVGKSVEGGVTGAPASASGAPAPPPHINVAAPPRDLQRVKNEHKNAPSRSRSPARSPKGSPGRCVVLLPLFLFFLGAPSSYHHRPKQK